MKRFGLLITLALAITIGGVYATWVYSQTNDVADVTGTKAINLTGATFEGSYGTYTIDVSQVSLTVDPKPGTTHVTSLLADGNVKIVFTPSTYAPQEVKDNGVETKYYLTLSNTTDWTYDDGNGAKNIIAVNHPDEKHDIAWTKEADGTFTYTLAAADLIDHLSLTEFTLDTKTAYDAYDAALSKGQIVIHVTDGQGAVAAMN